MTAIFRTALVSVADHILPRLPVRLYRGAEGSLLVAGSTRWCHAYPEMFFSGHDRSCEPLGTCTVWQLPRLLEQWRPLVDLVVARIDRFSSRRFASDRFFRAPEWIRTTAAVPGQGGRSPSGQARRNMRLVRKHRLGWRVSHATGDLETFIERDYIPYTQARFGPDAFLRSHRWFRDGFRRGGLVWIERDGEPIAGMTYDLRDASLRRLAFACVRGDASLLRTGAASATYLAGFDIARQHRCKSVDFRNSRPFLGDGLLSVKLSWGGRVAEPDDVTHEVLLGWNAVTPAVAGFFARSPLVARHGGGFAVVRSVTAGSRPRRIPSCIDRAVTLRPGAAFGDWTISVVSP